jgi:anti-sigma regulatory factor (Ser/Thr protein kinase)
LEEALTVSELTDVPPARAKFVDSLERWGVVGDELQGWKLIFTELVNNAVEHGCTNAGDTIRIRWWEQDSTVVVAVTDPSVGSISSADFDEATCDGFEDTGRGAGLFLIRAWVDEVKVSPGVGGGTEVRIQRRREPPQGRGSEQ